MRRKSHKQSVVFLQRSSVIPVRISFQAFDFGISHRGAVVTTRSVSETLAELRRKYVSVIVEGLRMEMDRPEEVKIYDAKTNNRMTEYEPGILNVGQGA